MKPIRFTLCALAAFVSSAPAFAGTFTADFTNPNASGYTLNGSGSLADGSTWTPVLSNGALVLTTNQINLQGSIVLDDLDSGQTIESFTAKFQLQMGPGSGNPADGFYFGFSPDINSSSVFAEEGPPLAGGGVGVEFDVYDNGIALQDTIGIDVMSGAAGGPFNGNNHNEVVLHPLAKSDMVTGTFKQVTIQLNRNGTLNLTYGNEVIYTNQYVYGWFPVNGQFIFDARTGGENQVCIISNLTVTTTPAGNYTPASITAQPQNASVKEGDTATFSVGFDGTPPFNFQWSKNGTALPFNTNNILTTADLDAARATNGSIQAWGPLNTLVLTNASPADNNAKFTVTVVSTNGDGTINTVTSQPVTLTVQADVTPPTLVSATASNDFQHVILVFSKPITPASAQAVANYSFNNGLTVSSAVLNTNDNRTVVLSTSPQAANTSYTLTLNNIKDTSFTGNSIVANTTDTFTSPVLRVVGVGALQSTNNASADVGVTFSSPLDPGSATNSANYKLSTGTIAEVKYFPQSPGVVLTATGLTPGSSYTLSVSNLANAVGSKMDGTNLSFTVSSFEWGVVGADQLGLGNAVIAVSTNGFDVYSDGISEWNNYDEATLVYQQITGDFDKKVRVEYQDASSQWARAGLVARDVPNFGVDDATQSGGTVSNTGTPPFTGTAGRYQKVHVNPVGPTLTGPGNLGNAAWEGNRRLDTGGPTTTALTGTNSVPKYPNAWCRLQRQGQTFTIYRSDNGTNWVKLGATTWPDPADPSSTPMPGTLYVGPEYSPENGNITDPASRGVFVAKFRDYSDTSAPISGGGGTANVSIQRTANGITLTFTGTLQSASSIAGPWTNVTGSSPLTVPATGSAQFYRATQ